MPACIQSLNSNSSPLSSDEKTHVKTLLFVSITILALGIILASTTTGGAPWRIGISVGMGTLFLSSLIGIALYYVKLKRGKSKEVKENAQLKKDLGKTILEDVESRENTAQAMQFNFLIASRFRRETIEKFSENEFILFLHHIDAKYTQPEGFSPPSGLLPDLKHRHNWEELARRAGISPSMFTALRDAI